LVVLGEAIRQHPDSDRLKLMLAGVHVCKYNYRLAEDIISTLDNPGANNDYFYVSAQLQLGHYADYDEADRLFNQWIEREDEDILSDKGLKDADEIRRDNYLHILTSVREFVHDDAICHKILTKWIREYIRVFSADGPLGRFETDKFVADVCRFENLPVLCEEMYLQLLETDPYLEGGWTVLAAAQYTNGKYEESVDSAEYALAVNPEDYFSLFTKANAFYAMSNFEAALADFFKYKECGLDSPDIFIASCLVRLERYEEARPYLASAEEWNEQDVTAEQPESYANNCYELAECYLLMGQPYKALLQVDKSLRYNPLNFDFLQTKGASLLALGRDDEALTAFLDSIEAYKADRAQGFLLTGLRYLNAGKPEAAIRFFLMSQTTDAPSLQSYAYIAYSYYQLGDTPRFMEYLRLSSEKCPDALREIMGHSMPEGIDPAGYYDYVAELLNRASLGDLNSDLEA
jgi:tetratricopeptide (TPR) repeat protein